MSKKSRKKSLSLFFVAILIILFLLLFIIPLWLGHSDTKMVAARFEISYIQNILINYHQGNGKYPTTEQGLKILTETTDKAGQPYLKKVPRDPWVNEYRYRSPGIYNKNSFDLWTYGSDNKAGGNEEHSQDITNWNLE